MATKFTPDEIKVRLDNTITAIKFALTNIIPPTAAITQVGISDQGNGSIIVDAEGSAIKALAIRNAIVANAQSRGIVGTLTIIGRRRGPDCVDTFASYAFTAQALSITIVNFTL